MTKTEIAEKIKNMISENLRIPENMLDDDAELFGGDVIILVGSPSAAEAAHRLVTTKE